MVTFQDRITEFRRVPASELTANPKNWRQHPAAQKAALTGLLEEIGFADAVIARETDDGLELIDGHLRQEVMGNQEIPVLIVDVTEEEADKMLATFDPISAMARTDKDALNKLLSNIETSNEKISGLLSTLDIFETEFVTIDELKPHPRNYVNHPPDQIEHLAESIRANGIYRNVVIANDGTILAGHGVVEAARKIEFNVIPVIRLTIDPEDVRALKLLASDNEISHLGEMNDRALTELLKEVKDTHPNGLLGTGYDDRMLASLLMVTRPKDEINDFEAAAEWVGMPEFVGEQEAHKSYCMMVYFDTPEDRRDLIKEITKLDPEFKAEPSDTKTAFSVWWPPRPNHDVNSVRFEGEQDDES
jgi:hypothetical protein|tara:strand:+ start:2341 stop:3423 length:1083 start_codon:yes stop_codon:yes gene_type:complete